MTFDPGVIALSFREQAVPENLRIRRSRCSPDAVLWRRFSVPGLFPIRRERPGNTAPPTLSRFGNRPQD